MGILLVDDAGSGGVGIDSTGGCGADAEGPDCDTFCELGALLACRFAILAVHNISITELLWGEAPLPCSLCSKMK